MLINHMKEIHLEANSPLTFTFTEDVEEFNFTVPAQDQFDRLLFSIHHRNAHPIVSEHDQRTTITLEHNNQNLRTHLRELPDRLFTVIPKELSGLCSNCNMSAIVNSLPGAIVDVELFAYSDVAKIKINKTYTDFVRQDGVNYYEIEVDDPTLMNDIDGHIHFSFMSLTGASKTIFVSGDNRPTILSQYFWSSELLG
jgi:hypothetical protein